MHFWIMLIISNRTFLVAWRVWLSHILARCSWAKLHVPMARPIEQPSEHDTVATSDKWTNNHRILGQKTQLLKLWSLVWYATKTGNKKINSQTNASIYQPPRAILPFHNSTEHKESYELAQHSCLYQENTKKDFCQV